MKIIEKDDEIILRDIPFKKWLSGIPLLLLFGFGGYAIFSDAINYPNSTFELQAGWLKIALNILWFLFIGGIIIFLAWLAIKDLFISQITTQIKPSAQTVDVISRKLIFIKKIERFYFSQIRGFEIIYPQPEEANLCFNVLTLVNGSQIDLESTGSKKDDTAKIRKKLNALLKKDKIKPAKHNSKRNKAPKTKAKMKAE
jgi:hypothetical protein